MANDNKIRNVKSFVQSYLKSHSGQSALNRKSHRGDVWSNNAIAVAMQKAVV
jgi:hypothetical protein